MIFTGSKSLPALLLAFLSWGLLLSTSFGAPIVEERAKPNLPDKAGIEAAIKPGSVPVKNPFFFSGFDYTGTKNAKKFAERTSLTHVGQIWKDANFVQVKNYEDGKDDEKVKNFRDNFSEVFAEKSEGTAYIVVHGDGNPSADRTFARKEFPALYRGGKVTKIVQLPESILADTTKTAVAEADGLRVLWAIGEAALFL